MGEARTVGGSLVSRILGMSKWGGPLAAYFELAEGVEAKREHAMGRGNLLESSVIGMWCELAGGVWIAPPARITAPTMPYAHATLDAIIDHGPQEDESPRFQVAEAKTLASEQMGAEWGPDGSDRLAPEYHLQALWYLGVAQAAGLEVLPTVAVPVLVGPEAQLAMAAKLVERTGRPLALADLEGTDLELRGYRVEWDATLFATVDRRVQRFLAEHVAPRIPPMPGEGDILMDRDRSAVKRGLRAMRGKAVDINALAAPVQSTVASYLEAVRQRKAWADLEADRATLVQLAMRDVEEIHGLDGGARVTWKEIKGGSRRFELKEPRK